MPIRRCSFILDTNVLAAMRPIRIIWIDQCGDCIDTNIVVSEYASWQENSGVVLEMVNNPHQPA